MDNFESKPSPAPVPQPGYSSTPRTTLEELEREHSSLRQLLTSALILMIVVSGTLNLFLLRQAKYTRQDLNNIRPQVSQMVAEFNKVNAPAINNFAQKMVEFGQKNPDFMPIVVKYGLVQTGAGPARVTGPISPTNPAIPAPAPKK